VSLPSRPTRRSEGHLESGSAAQQFHAKRHVSYGGSTCGLGDDRTAPLEASDLQLVDADNQPRSDKGVNVAKLPDDGKNVFV
jgi:hypothetical protein